MRKKEAKSEREENLALVTDKGIDKYIKPKKTWKERFSGIGQRFKNAINLNRYHTWLPLTNIIKKLRLKDCFDQEYPVLSKRQIRNYNILNLLGYGLISGAIAFGPGIYKKLDSKRSDIIKTQFMNSSNPMKKSQPFIEFDHKYSKSQEYNQFIDSAFTKTQETSTPDNAKQEKTRKTIETKIAKQPFSLESLQHKTLEEYALIPHISNDGQKIIIETPNDGNTYFLNQRDFDSKQQWIYFGEESIEIPKEDFEKAGTFRLGIAENGDPKESVPVHRPIDYDRSQGLNKTASNNELIEPDNSAQEKESKISQIYVSPKSNPDMGPRKWQKTEYASLDSILEKTTPDSAVHTTLASLANNIQKSNPDLSAFQTLQNIDEAARYFANNSDTAAYKLTDEYVGIDTAKQVYQMQAYAADTLGAKLKTNADKITLENKTYYNHELAYHLYGDKAIELLKHNSWEEARKTLEEYSAKHNEHGLAMNFTNTNFKKLVKTALEGENNGYELYLKNSAVYNNAFQGDTLNLLNGDKCRISVCPQ